MRICRNCRRENPDDARFCIYCSFSLEWESERPHEAPTSEETVILEPAPDIGKAGVYVGLSATSLSVVAGGATTCDVHVRNVGAITGRYRLAVSGPAAGLGQLSPSELALEPGEEGTAVLGFAAPRTDSGLSVLDFDVRAESERDPRVAAKAHGALQVVPGASRATGMPAPVDIPALLKLFVAAAVLAMVQAGFVDDRFFLNDFGGAGHFRSNAALHVAQFVSGLPVLFFGATAAVGIALAGRRRRSEQVTAAGLLVATGAQAAGLFVVAASKWSDARFGVALLGAVVVLGAGVWALSAALGRGVERSKLADLEAWERRTVYLGLAASAVGLVVPFNTVLVGESETKYGATAVEGAAVFAGVALILLCTRLELPRPGFGAVLLAAGIGTASVWIRFAAVSRLETPEVADPGYGAVIGLCGAIALTLAAAAILSEVEDARALAPVPSSHA